MRARKRTEVPPCGPYRTSEPPEQSVPERELDTQLLLEGLVIVSSGLVVLVSGLLSEHAVGPIATFGAAMVGGAVWDVWRQFGRRQRDRSVL